MENNQIIYRSTRSRHITATASDAILQGIAPDGGLFVPERFPEFTESFEWLSRQTYQQVALKIMGMLLTDFTQEELKHCIDSAYDSKFDIPEITRLKKADHAWYLELFHGTTIAFKDMALSILPHLMTTAARKRGVKDEIVILTATSGDTGKAAMAGFADVPGTKIIVFYPKGGVSAVQEKQMLTQRGENVHVVGIHGNFDDAQTAVKRLFGDEDLAERMAAGGMRFSSANSINIGRLVPQIVYYFYAYGQMVKAGEVRPGGYINVCVPTGNFGNILAAFYAKKMGLPIENLLCASNENKVLVDFFQTGVYDRNRAFILTSSPSMDILISSNLERLVYEITDQNPDETNAFMKELAETGTYKITPEMRAKLKEYGFYGDYASEAMTSDEIRKVYEDTGYVLDPHTAVASNVHRRYLGQIEDQEKTVIASTASPYKFARSVVTSIRPQLAEQDGGALSDDALIDMLADLSGVAMPRAIREIRNAPILHDTVVDVPDMKKEVMRWLGIGHDSVS